MKSAFWNQTPSISKSSLKRKHTSLVLTTSKRAKEAQQIHDDPMGYHEAIVRSLEPNTQSSYLLHTAWDLSAYLAAQTREETHTRFGAPVGHPATTKDSKVQELALQYFRGVEKARIPAHQHQAAHLAPPPLLPLTPRTTTSKCISCGWDLDDQTYSTNSGDSCPQCGELIEGAKRYVFNFQDSQHRTTRTSPPYIRTIQFSQGINDLQGRHRRPLPPKDEMDRILEQLKQIESARRHELQKQKQEGKQTPSLRTRLLRAHQTVADTPEKMNAASVEITIHDVKSVLAKLGLSKHNPFIATIMKKYNGTPLPVLPPEYVQALDFLLMQINSVYDEAKSFVAEDSESERKSFFSQFYLQFKLLSAIGASSEWLDRIKLLRNPQIVGRQEKIYQKCCELLNWHFVPVPDLLLKQN